MCVCLGVCIASAVSVGMEKLACCGGNCALDGCNCISPAFQKKEGIRCHCPDRQPRIPRMPKKGGTPMMEASSNGQSGSARVHREYRAFRLGAPSRAWSHMLQLLRESETLISTKLQSNILTHTNDIIRAGKKIAANVGLKIKQTYSQQGFVSSKVQHMVVFSRGSTTRRPNEQNKLSSAIRW